MRQLIIYIFFVLFGSTYGQEKLKFDVLNSSNLIVLKLIQKDINTSIYPNQNKYLLDNIFILVGEPKEDFRNRKNQYIRLEKEGETMLINCLFCSNDDNLYFDNFHFKKGHYVIDYVTPMIYDEKRGRYVSNSSYILGENLQVSERIKKSIVVFFTDFQGIEGYSKEFPFTSFRFKEIDMRDTTNVKIRKMTKEEEIEIVNFFSRDMM